MEYSYVNHVNYVNLKVEEDPADDRGADGGVTGGEKPDSCLREQLPHIRFTPCLRMILGEILHGKTRPLRKARRIYDFITTNVKYSFVRE